MIIKTTDGQKIKKLRKKRGITLKTLSKLLNISESMMSLIERDKRTITLAKVKLICVIFNVELNYFNENEEI